MVSSLAKTVSVLLVIERSRESDALVDRLNREEGIEIATCTSNGVAVAVEIEPNVVVFDIDVPDVICFETARVIQRTHPRCRLMFIGAEVDDHSIQEALDVGALAYLTKQEPPSAVATAMREVANGRAVFSGRVCERFVVESDESTDPRRTRARKNLLTAREIEIVRYIAQGLADKEIAAAANISTKTVEAHCAHIRNKLGVRGRVDIARFAIREGLASA
ncbi:MAG: response regulator transcription factor [Planctomycetes bacterium]|nr:response regulator transcription factor [Planctomycetota bacterium]